MSIQYGIDGLRQIDKAECQRLAAARPSDEAIRAAGFDVETIDIAASDYYDFKTRVDYDANFPSYMESFAAAYEQQNKSDSFVNRKLYEQFLCYMLTRPTAKSVVVDLAADKCPFAKILHSTFGVQTVYHQDLNPVSTRKFPYLADAKLYDARKPNAVFGTEYLSGLTMIVCNAVSLPFADNSVDYMYLLNSWEHFQAPSDLDTLVEIERCLKPGGKLIIVPLNLAAQSFVMTDSNVWATKQVYEQGQLPQFRTDVPVCDTSCTQTYAQHHGLDLLTEFAKVTTGLSYTFVRLTLKPDQSWLQNEEWYALVLEKKRMGLAGALRKIFRR